MALRFRGKRIGVEKNKKQSKKETSFYIAPDTEEFAGTIKYISAELQTDLKVGDRVCFGNQFQLVKLEGADICVMEDTNVLATIDEEKPKENQ